MGLLLFLGRNLAQGSALLTGGLTLGAMTAITVLVASLYRVRNQLRASRMELARKEAELTFAREVQRQLFPRKFPQCSGLEFAATCIPARGISGDYYDVMQFPDGRLSFAIADISGKGISAAILMANLQALLRTLAQTLRAPSEIACTLNRHLLEVTGESRFATLFYAEWDPRERRIRYVNAGHHPPVLLGSARGNKLTNGGFPIGLFSESEFQEGELQLQPGDMLVLYSDGITEAETRRGEEFGQERLESLIAENAERSLLDIEMRVLDAVGKWSGREPEDDMTLLIVRATNGTNACSALRPYSDCLAVEAGARLCGRSFMACSSLQRKRRVVAFDSACCAGHTRPQFRQLSGCIGRQPATGRMARAADHNRHTFLGDDRHR